METLEKVIYAVLYLLLSSIMCFSQNTAESDSLSFKRGSFSNQYYIGNHQVSYDNFIEKLSHTNGQSVKMFKNGRSVSTAGIAIGCVGAFCFGYDLGGRLTGAEGLTERIKENDMVSFDLDRALKGMNCVNVKKI